MYEISEFLQWCSGMLWPITNNRDEAERNNQSTHSHTLSVLKIIKYTKVHNLDTTSSNFIYILIHMHMKITISPKWVLKFRLFLELQT